MKLKLNQNFKPTETEKKQETKESNLLGYFPNNESTNNRVIRGCISFLSTLTTKERKDIANEQGLTDQLEAKDDGLTFCLVKTNDGYKLQKASFCPSDSALYHYILMLFTKNNDLKQHRKEQAYNLEVSFNCREYAEYRGYNLSLKSDRDTFRRSFLKSFLFLCEFGEAVINEESGNLRLLKFITEFEPPTSTDSSVTIVLGDGYIKKCVVKKRPIYTPFISNFLQVDPQDTTAYNIMFKLNEYSNILNNQEVTKDGRKQAEVIRIKSLYKETGLPTAQEIKTNRWSWKQRAKKPFEEAVYRLMTKYNYLGTFKLLKERGKQEITIAQQETNETAKNYIIRIGKICDSLNMEDWLNLKFNHKVLEVIDHSEALAKKQERREHRKELKERRATKEEIKRLIDNRIKANEKKKAKAENKAQTQVPNETKNTTENEEKQD